MRYGEIRTLLEYMITEMYDDDCFKPNKYVFDRYTDNDLTYEENAYMKACYDAIRKVWEEYDDGFNLDVNYFRLIDWMTNDDLISDWYLTSPIMRETVMKKRYDDPIKYFDLFNFRYDPAKEQLNLENEYIIENVDVRSIISPVRRLKDYDLFLDSIERLKYNSVSVEDKRQKMYDLRISWYIRKYDEKEDGSLEYQLPEDSNV